MPSCPPSEDGLDCTTIAPSSPVARAPKLPQIPLFKSSDPMVIDACDKAFYSLAEDINDIKETLYPLYVGFTYFRQFYGWTVDTEDAFISEGPITSLPQLSRLSVQANARLLELVEESFSRLMLTKRRDLYKHQNALVSINKLPSELLAHIFYYHLDLKAVIDIPDTKDQTSYMGILWGLASVCTHWKQVVTNSPRLWAHATAHDPLTLMIRKAKAVPFTIRFLPLGSESSRHRQKKLDVTCTYAQQMRSLAVFDHDLRSIVDCLVEPLPFLEELYLWNTSGSQHTSSKFGGGQNLLVVRLRGVSFNWDGANISNLTVLEIKEVQETMTFYDELLGALGWCPNLQELAVNTTPTSDMPKAVTYPIQIDLPSLESLKVQSTGFSLLPSLIFGHVGANRLQSLIVTVEEGTGSHIVGHARLFGLHGGYNYLSTVLSNSSRWSRLKMQCSDGVFSISNSKDSELVVTIPSGSSHMGAILASLRVPHLLIEVDLSSWGTEGLSTAFLSTISTLSKLTVNVDSNPTLVDNILSALARPTCRTGDVVVWPSLPYLARLHIQGKPLRPFGMERVGVPGTRRQRSTNQT
ncbi:hypothetical protein FRB99_008173 [Tulasnella sp. 403]|nr:hypothetical protein FRB99_008173 [Tulasnella sp. 403]